MGYKISIAVLGARMGYQEADILNRANLLERLYTDFYIGNKPFLRKILSLISFKPAVLKGLLGRVNNNLPANKIKSFDVLGIRYWIQRFKLRSQEKIDVLDARINGLFNKKVIDNLPENVSAVYGMNGASLEMFQWAKSRGIKCILHQTIAPKSIERKILFEEFHSKKNELEEREKKEIALADLILCASKFTRDSLIKSGADPSKCRIVIYQINLPNTKFHRVVTSRYKKIRVIFAGAVGYRKGAHYLLEAVDKLDLKDFEIVFAGENNLPEALIKKYRNKVRFLGRVPREEMNKVYQNSDVLVFPSLCEGFGFVIPEAMNYGLPVIATQNTVAPEMIKSGKEGFIIPIRDSTAIAKYLDILNKDRKLLYKMSCAAYKRARKINPKIYESQLIQELKSIIKS